MRSISTRSLIADPFMFVKFGLDRTEWLFTGGWTSIKYIRAVRGEKAVTLWRRLQGCQLARHQPIYLSNYRAPSFLPNRFWRPFVTRWRWLAEWQKDADPCRGNHRGLNYAT